MVTTRSRAGAPVADSSHQPETEVDENTVDQGLRGVSGRKRSRDYGEELKGLTPDRESEVQASPAAKRARTVDGDEHREKAQSNDLDDGEIVEETSVAGQPADSLQNAPTHKTESELQPKVVQSATPVNQPSPDQPVVPEQLVTTDSKAAVGISHTGDEAELADSKENTKRSRESEGRNQGVGLGLRTSFAKAPNKQFKPGVPLSVRGTVSFPMMNKDWKIDATQFDQLVCDSELNHAERFKPRFWKDWMNDNLEKIVRVLEEENDFSVASIRKKQSQQSKLLRNAMVNLLHPNGGILTGSKKDMHQARAVANSVFDEQVNSKGFRKKIHQFTKAPETETNGQKGERKDGSETGDKPQENKGEEGDEEQEEEDDEEDMEEDEEKGDDGASESRADESMDIEPGELLSDDSPPTDPEELEHRRLYFPGSEDYPKFCLHCVSVKHKSNNCPQLVCQFCGNADHTRYACPTKQRCSKCRQMGHTKDTCQEKIALAKEEMEPCVYCGSSHTEDQCHEIWKSFNPAEAQIKKVKLIPAFCYICGAEGHYGPECGLSSGVKDMDTGLSIWSCAIRDYYVDPNSTNTAIAWTGLDTSRIQSGSNLQIRGQAKRQTHVYYVSSDDSDDGFIRDPVQKPPQRGNIQVNTNNSRPAPRRGGFSSLRGNESRRRQEQREFTPPPQPPLELYHDYASWQPPLPPGPPPPVPGAYNFQGNTASLPQAPPGTLPPRPGYQGSRNASGGSQNGSKRGRGRPRRGR